MPMCGPCRCKSESTVSKCNLSSWTDASRLLNEWNAVKASLKSCVLAGRMSVGKHFEIRVLPQAAAAGEVTTDRGM
jgi:hypothetical protein